VKQSDYHSGGHRLDLVAQLSKEMLEASRTEFEKAAELRDSIAQIEAELAA
jgi:excinuclease ABC subunit B